MHPVYVLLYASSLCVAVCIQPVCIIRSFCALFSSTVNQVGSEPRKYTPSHTWAAVHGDSRGSNGSGPGQPSANAAPQAGPYKPPPSNRYREPAANEGYRPSGYK